MILALPLTVETEDLVDDRALALMKRTAWLVNVARGRLVVERALLRALGEGRLGRRRAGRVPRRAAAAGLAVLRPAQRHRHAAHVLVERPRPGPERRALRRQPAALRLPGSRSTTGWTRWPDTDGMQIAIVGLAGSGKTTVFNTLTRGNVQTGGFGGMELHVGVVKVPDPRLDRLAEIFHPRKIVHADVTYVDLPAPPASSEGRVGTEELPAEHLARLRDADALLHVVRGWDDPALPHPAGSVDPWRDLEQLDLEFVLADLAVVDRRLERLRGAGRHGSPAEREANEREAVLLDQLRDAARRRPPDPRRGARPGRREAPARVPVPDPEAGPGPAQRRRGATWRPRRAGSPTWPPATSTVTRSSIRSPRRSRWSWASSTRRRPPSSARSWASPNRRSTA